MPSTDSSSLKSWRGKRINGRRKAEIMSDHGHQLRDLQKNNFNPDRKNMQGNQAMKNRQGNNKNNQKINGNQANNKGRFTFPPTHTPTLIPTPFPTPQPTLSPTPAPTRTPTQMPTITSTSFPSMNYDIRLPTRMPVSTSLPVTSPPSLIRSQNFDSSTDILASMSPTASISTSTPTKAPSVLLKFSVLMSEDHQNIKAEHVLSNNDEGMVLNILQSTTISICQNTDYKVITLINPDRNLCDIIQNRRKLRSEIPPLFSQFEHLKSNKNNRKMEENKEDTEDDVYAVLSIDPLASVDSASDKVLGNTTFLEIALRCGVEEIGPFYTRMSDMSFGTKSPISMIESTVQEVVDDTILDGSFLMNIKGQEDENDSKVVGVAILGNEIKSFLPFESVLNETNNTFDLASIENEEFIVAPMHSTRLAGIILMLCIITLTFSLFSAGRRRKKKYEWTEVDKKLLEEKEDTLRLSSEDAVTAMLNVGRNISREKQYSKIIEEDSVDQEPIKLTSTWEVMIGAENTVLNNYEQVIID